MIAISIWLALVMAGVAMLAANTALFVQACAVLFKPDKPKSGEGERPLCVVLVPAHNEADGIARTVHALVEQTQPHDRIFVIADNCSDDTAGLAHKAGAEILIRTDDRKRGKGHALSAGLLHVRQHLELCAPVVVFVDADCRFDDGNLDVLVRACAGYDAPVQCRNLMVQGPTAQHADKANKSRLGEFAWRVRNDFRPTGYARLGLPCQLFGTGMAMPARLAVPELFATGHVTEDLLIGVEAALGGAAPRYVRQSSLFSHFPETASGTHDQKKRWIHGHFSVILSHAPRLIGLGIWRRDRELVAMGADLMTPPLTLLAAAHVTLTVTSAGTYALTGAVLPVILAMTGLVLFSFSMVSAWRFCGRGLIGWREIAEVPRHAVHVVSTAVGFMSGKRSAWVRADRTHVR